MSVHSPSYVRLSDPVRTTLDRRGAPGRDAFVAYCKRHGHRIKAYAAYTDLRAGVAIDRAAGEAFVRYLVHRRYIDAAAAESALVPAVPPPLDEGLLATPNSVLATLLGPLHGFLEDRNVHYVRDPGAEIPRIAESIVTFVGRLNPSLDDGLSDRARGEAIMARTVEEHARWLLAIHARDRHAIMYGVKEYKGRPRVVSVSVMFATTAEACERFCAGAISDLDITPADLLPCGKFLHVNAVAPTGDWELFGAKDVERSQIRSIYMQAAYFTRGTTPFRPTVYSIGANPVYERRLAAHGYAHTGATVKGTDKPVMRMQHPADRGQRWTSRRHRVAYSIFCFTLKLFQSWNRKRWAGRDQPPLPE